MMEFVSISDGKITWTEKLDTKPCPACGNLMVSTYETSNAGIPDSVLKAAGIRQKHVIGDDIEVCVPCLYEGNFKMECSNCRKDFVFPAEFAMRLRHVSDWSDDEYYDYICNTCTLETIDRADLIRMAVNAYNVFRPDTTLSHLNKRLY